jgi:serine protease
LPAITKLRFGAAAAACGISLAAAPALAQGDVYHAPHSMNAKAAHGRGGGGSNLSYHGGPVQHTPRLFIVYPGWTSGSDPNGEGVYLEKFLNGVGSSKWLDSVTQYNDSSGQYVGGPSGQLVTTWTDPSPAYTDSSPTDADLQAEALQVANHFAGAGHAYSADNNYIIATAHNHNSTGFAANGGNYCAYHDVKTGAVSGSTVSVSFTNLPYQTDAGLSCGENFVNAASAGLLDGVSIVTGHEVGETQTDPQPATGTYAWLDNGGQENGDKCAWIQPFNRRGLQNPGGAFDLPLSTGTFAVQSLWSNSLNGGAGGCADWYVSATSQGQFSNPPGGLWY